MIVWDDGTKKQRIYEMWQDNFHDPVSYADFYFKEVYGKNEVLINQEEDVAKGMLHLNPYLLHVNEQPVRAKYIVGVATDKEYRRQGVMKELLIESFQILRSREECFTYLMSADENYYLPFDFRFGMTQIEQEVEYLPDLYIPEEREAEKYTFKAEISEAELEKITAQENAVKDTVFDIYTDISPDYIRRMEKEVESDFGQVLYVFEGEKYIGRTAVGAEDSYFVLSQVFCADDTKRESFLEQTMLYCEKKYHYNRYQLILDTSWKDATDKIGLQGCFRYMPAKRVKKIMFRLLDLEKLSVFLKCNVPGAQGYSTLEEKTADGEEAICEADIYIEDNYLEEQSGVYHFLLKNGKVLIQKTGDTKGDCKESISVAAFTEYLFGAEEECVDDCTTLSGETKNLLKNICPLSKNCIMEIV